MSAYFAKHGKPEEKKYTKHGRTKQSQKDECDINKLLERSARSGSLSHLQQFEAQYGTYANYDFEEHINTIAEGQNIFEHLPAEIKREFAQSPQRFFEYVTDEANKDRLPELLPQIANQGNYLLGIDPPRTTVPEIPDKENQPPENKSPPGENPPGDKQDQPKGDQKNGADTP